MKGKRKSLQEVISGINRKEAGYLVTVNREKGVMDWKKSWCMCSDSMRNPGYLWWLGGQLALVIGISVLDYIGENRKSRGSL